MIEIFCDGACHVSTGEGGFGVVVLEDNKIICAYNNSASDTTNNKEEIKALLFSLDYIDANYPDEEVRIYSDSAYVVNMFNDWIFKWAVNGWRKADKKPIENRSLVEELYKYASKPFNNYNVQRCPGHEGVTGNELADALATNNIKRFNKLINEEELILIDWLFEFRED